MSDEAFHLTPLDIRRYDFGTALLYAANVTLAKFPQMLGMIRFLRNRRAGRREKIIEYK